MMIRSQDKKKLYPLTKGLYTDGTNIIMDLGFSVTGDGDLQLGKYASLQRCIEILDDIQKKYQTYLGSEGGISPLQGGGIYQPFAFIPPHVYEMPEE